MTAFNIQHGRFHDVEGAARPFGEVIFVPAKVTLDGFQDSEPLLAEPPAEIASMVEDGEDAPWVLSRLMRLFLTEAGSVDKAYFIASFLAVFPGRENLAVPFMCTDERGRVVLLFSQEDGPPAALRQDIADAFRGLLLAEPDGFSEYEARIFHAGVASWIRFGMEGGRPFVVDEPDEG